MDVIFSDRLSYGFKRIVFDKQDKGSDLTKGMSFPKTRKVLIGTQKKVKVLCYDGKSDFYINRPIMKYNPVISYQKRLNITIIAII